MLWGKPQHPLWSNKSTLLHTGVSGLGKGLRFSMPCHHQSCTSPRSEQPPFFITPFLPLCLTLFPYPFHTFHFPLSPYSSGYLWVHWHEGGHSDSLPKFYPFKYLPAVEKWIIYDIILCIINKLRLSWLESILNWTQFFRADFRGLNLSKEPKRNLPQK